MKNEDILSLLCIIGIIGMVVFGVIMFKSDKIVEEYNINPNESSMIMDIPSMPEPIPEKIVVHYLPSDVVLDIEEAQEGVSNQKEDKIYDEDEKIENKAYLGVYELTAYISTGNPCADGSYPSVKYTVASNDGRLWHKWIHIEGYGDYYVHDTGGMASNVLDVYVGSYDEAIQFGRRIAEVYIIE